MDAKEGTIVIDPDEKTRAEYLARQETYEKEQKQLEQLRTAKTVTLDGKRIFLCVNAGSLEDIRQALPMQIDGVGLFRSEFLYMEHSHFPTEEEQFMVYREAARLSPGELTIRTLDIGGDKALSYFPMEKEANPFLGWRGIRISLDKEELFKEQIRAILRAGAFGHVRLLFPMIISMDELYRAKALVQTCKEELRDAGMAFDETMRIGMMIETPASVLLAEEFAAQVDFFSIGTNDLTQYILAVDRGNKKLSDRYDWMHPAVLRAIQWVIEAGHKAGIQVGMCGEMAGSAQAIPVLLKMGLDEFSMSAGNLDDARSQILGCSCTNTDSWKNMKK
jgi:phosphotransferase system enzyme I (PtsI)